MLDELEFLKITHGIKTYGPASLALTSDRVSFLKSKEKLIATEEEQFKRGTKIPEAQTTLKDIDDPIKLENSCRKMLLKIDTNLDCISKLVHNTGALIRLHRLESENIKQQKEAMNDLKQAVNSIISMIDSTQPKTPTALESCIEIATSSFVSKHLDPTSSNPDIIKSIKQTFDDSIAIIKLDKGDPYAPAATRLKALTKSDYKNLKNINMLRYQKSSLQQARHAQNTYKH